MSHDKSTDALDIATMRRVIGLVGLLALNIAPAVIAAFVSEHGLEFHERILIPFASACCLALMAACQRSFPRLLMLALIATSCIAALQTWCLLEYGWVIDSNLLSVLRETNRSEAMDFASSMPLLLPAVGLAAIACLAALAWPRSGQALMSGRTARRLFMYGLIGGIGIGLIVLPDLLERNKFDADNPFRPPPRGMLDAMRAVQPIGIGLVAMDYLQDRRELDAVAALKRNFVFGIRPLPHASQRRIYVLVVGESTRADRLGLNGYARQTTPELSRITGLTSFRHMYGFYTYSRLAIPLILTRKALSTTTISNEASIIRAFHEAGFRTAWISMQAPYGYHDAPVSLYAYEADQVEFLNPSDYRTHGHPDGYLLKAFDQAISKDRRDTFVVLHMLGSHFVYSDRYPPEFAHFLPDRRPDRALKLLEPNDKTFLSNGYDNTVLYEDYVLASLIHRLDRENAQSWLLYSSDHGEEIFDDCRMWAGHGQSTERTHSVASIFWPSASFARMHPELVSSMRSHARSLLSTSMLFETMTDLGGFSVAGNRADNSLARPLLRHPTEIVDALRDSSPSCGTASMNGIVSPRDLK